MSQRPSVFVLVSPSVNIVMKGAGNKYMHKSLNGFDFGFGVTLMAMNKQMLSYYLKTIQNILGGPRGRVGKVAEFQGS